MRQDVSANADLFTVLNMYNTKPEPETEDHKYGTKQEQTKRDNQN